MLSGKKATKANKRSPKKEVPENATDQPCSGYLTDEQLRAGLIALKKFNKIVKKKRTKKDLLEASDDNDDHSSKVFVEVVFKNIPSNTKTYIHNIVLPHHWHFLLDPEDLRIALFVKHVRPKNEALRIMLARDRDADIENTHSHYKDLFEDKLDESLRSRVSKIISTKELATEYNTPAKLDRLVKSYDIFLCDRRLMSDKLNSLPRRLGRRFWVRERKVPLKLKLNSINLDESFERVLRTAPFYLLGRSATEKIQIGLMRQPREHLVQNTRVFLDRLFNLYGSSVRYIKLRSEHGPGLPIFADLGVDCPRVQMKSNPINQ